MYKMAMPLPLLCRTLAQARAAPELSAELVRMTAGFSAADCRSHLCQVLSTGYSCSLRPTFCCTTCQGGDSYELLKSRVQQGKRRGITHKLLSYIAS